MKNTDKTNTTDPNTNNNANKYKIKDWRYNTETKVLSSTGNKLYTGNKLLILLPPTKKKKCKHEKMNLMFEQLTITDKNEV